MIMAGGTGGHVFPALAVAHRLRELGADVFWLGTHQGLEAHLVPEHGIRIEWLNVQGLRSTGWKRWLAAPMKIMHALFQAWRVLRRNRPTAVLGMGGFVSGPGGLMARIMGIPLVIHEQNALAGLTNRWLAKVADRVMIAFPNALPNGTVCGNPVRRDIVDIAEPAERFAERTGNLRLLVLGGSQGARALNELMPEWLAGLNESQRPQVWHQAGKADFEAAAERYRKAGLKVRVEAFIHDMQEAYAWADMVLCRAGALTIAELAAAGVGAVLVPYPYAVDDHQTVNAAFLVDRDAGILLPQSELSVDRLNKVMEPFLNHRERALAMAINSRALAQPDATEQVARACLEVEN